jgi:hypothetical protein
MEPDAEAAAVLAAVAARHGREVVVAGDLEFRF